MCLKVKTTSQGLLKNISIQSLSKTKVLKKIWMNRINSLKSFWADISFVLQTINPNLNPTNQTEGSNTYYGCYLILILVPWCQDKVKFIYSEKASKCCEIFTLHLPKVHTVKSKVKISQTFVAFSEFMNFSRFKKFKKCSYLLHRTNLRWRFCKNVGLLRIYIWILPCTIQMESK